MEVNHTDILSQSKMEKEAQTTRNEAMGKAIGVRWSGLWDRGRHYLNTDALIHNHELGVSQRRRTHPPPTETTTPILSPILPPIPVRLTGALQEDPYTYHTFHIRRSAMRYRLLLPVIVTLLIMAATACGRQTPRPTPTPQTLVLTQSSIERGIPLRGTTLELEVFPEELKIVIGPVTQPDTWEECKSTPCWRAVVLLPWWKPVTYEIRNLPTASCWVVTYQAGDPFQLDEEAIKNLVQQLGEAMGSWSSDSCCEGVELVILRP